MDDISKSQLWNCPNGKDILDALVELYPTCRAVVFETSKKMFRRVYLALRGTMEILVKRRKEWKNGMEKF